MVGFIDDHRGEHGVEPICDVLPIAPSTYYGHLAKRADPARRLDRARRDEALRPEILRVFEENWRVYGVRKIWRQLGREGFDVARCTVARLMKGMDIQGIIRGKPHKTTIPDKRQPCPLDKVNRQFRVPAPNMLWVSDFTYVATWRGFVYVAFVIDAYARRIVGWRVSTSAHAGFVLDALEQAVHERCPVKGIGLVHHGDRGSQYLSIKYTERLAEDGIEPRWAASATATLEDAPVASGCARATVVRRPRLLSDNGSSYISGELADWLAGRGMDYVRGAPRHPQTQGKIERWHQTLKNRILLENYYLPGALEEAVAAFIEHYNHHRYQESLGNLTPADVYLGKAETILERRKEIKARTIAKRRLASIVRPRHKLQPQRARSSVRDQALVSQII